MTVVLESLAFFSLAPQDEIVEPEVAEENREGALTELRRMSEEERKEFAQFASGYADEELKQEGAGDRVDFFRELAREFGG